MGIHNLTGYMLIESPEFESDEQFLTMVEALLLEVGIARPRSDWVLFSAGDRFVRGGVQFREFVCAAGSALGLLMLRAGRDGGLPRAIILRNEDAKHCWEIRNGVESEFDRDELHPFPEQEDAEL
jgi:hypothetical protein